jgi:hypothetical protein
LGVPYQAPRAFTFRVNRDILRAAVFLCNTPFDEALAIAGTAMESAAFELSLSFVSIALNADLTIVLILDLIEAFLSRFFRLCLLLFSADRCEANDVSPSFIISKQYLFMGFLLYIPGLNRTFGLLGEAR